MLKVRIIPCLLFKDRTIVKSVKFDELRMVGDSTTCARVFNERNADEMMFLDVMASRRGTGPNFDVVKAISDECFMPLTVGGGIRSLEDADKLFRYGADKVVINSSAFSNPSLITEIIQKYGSQAVVGSIDVKKVDEKYVVYTECGQTDTKKTPEECVDMFQELGVGELLLCSIDRDGTMEGYDLELIERVAKVTHVPLVAVGGCGKADHIVEAIDAGADAVSAASVFFWVGESITTLKNDLLKKDVQVRIVK